MTFAQMQAETRRQLNESSVVFWTDQDIKDAINEGMDELADIAEYYERQATLPMLAGRSYYDLTSVLPDTVLSPRHIWNTTTQRWLEQVDTLQMDGGYRQWELVHGEPEKFVIRGHWWLGAWPKRDTDSSSLRLYYTGIPDHLSASTDVPPFPQEFHMGPVEFALSDLNSQQRETKRAVKHWNEFMSYAARLKAYADQRASIPRRGAL